ncbi:tyrosine-type recombinase/integrase [Thermoactinomyces sp. CICC 10522]|uniref:tyrosine-type recombinase/integrase n=1 Tax=Thermoactinomyces sp. CICC 10522 TaxID=2767427 RepID=UPI0018DDDAE3|nr:tyrosine-type recombinase/integrase [Thermoactinomyces sp. CICC 10522]MBH8603676.1 tyrosine-type recombinase/integrase [Thermoactinomyces sp. CICC 10522]
MSEKPRKAPVRERKGKSLIKSRNAATSSAANIFIKLTFKEALELFVNAKKAEGMRPRTISDYYKHMEWFQRFLSEFYPDVKTIQQLTADIIRRYINYLRDERNPYAGNQAREKDTKGLAINTINIRLRTLRAMCRFWTEEDYLVENPMAKIKPLRKDTIDDMTGFTEKELKALFSVLDTRQYSNFRDKVIMLLLLDTGIRINELVNVQISHLDVKRLTLTIPAEIAKNRKSRTIPVSRKVMKLLLELHEENKQYFEPTEFLFLTAYGDQMLADTFRRRLWKYAEEAGIERATPHMFRHTFARDYLLAGGDVFTLQLILDHADIATTRRYVQMDENHVKEQHQRFSPASKYLK